MILSDLKQQLAGMIPSVYLHLFNQLSKDNNFPEIEILFYLLSLERERGNLALNLSPPAIQAALEECFAQQSPPPGEHLTVLAHQLSNTDLLNCPFIALRDSPGEPDYQPLILYRSHPSHYLYFHREFMAVQKVGRKLALLRIALSAVDLQDALKISETIAEQSDYILNPEQKLAFALAVNLPFTVITGGPGTGKSSIVKYLIRYFNKFAPANQKIPTSQIKLCAPTGKAANRLQESISSEGGELFCGTIHRMLEYQSGRFRYHEKNPLPAALVIIDEVSMIDIVLMDALLSALRKDCRIIFLGDRNQLPPVGSGAMLSELVPDFNSCRYDESLIKNTEIQIGGDVQKPAGERTVHGVVFLTRNMRENLANQTLPNSITSVASAVLHNQRQAITEFFDKCTFKHLHETPNGCSRLDLIQNDFLPTLLSFCQNLHVRTLQADRNNPEEINQILCMGKILTFLREGKSGSIFLNRQINRQLSDSNDSLFAGLHIMITVNDRIAELNNGDTGVIFNFGKEGLKAGFVKNGQMRWFNPNQLPSWEPAWCITVHKSQGSEYQEAVIILPGEANHRMTYRELLYTAITRARKKAILIGSQEVMSAAAARKFRRENGYPFWDAKP